ncbi:amino acid adenylation domain-containing protein [Marinomonas posidonica]|uniref:Amino acid adenylation domain protein n=1 Tax=Marinomonas posidonica (strain CECT 7376 / NCIMB 14433 / IVIA-Po-181) TaxID=491952 RepID=F6CXF0_MARPP|nr:amino acid adenylation domain-containing protein [Marinomonas posidonica]AEF55566.1 amino acid adenylation domain protein [Marinomonas posidonica IVIA-Po-181]
MDQLITPNQSGDTLHDRFEQQVQIWPDKIAVSYQDQQLTYQQLDVLAKAHSEELISRGVQSGDMVAVMLSRSVDLIVHIIAVLKTGACYVPIDPNYPADRVEWVIETSTPVCFISRRELCQNIWPEQLPSQLKERFYFIESAPQVNVNNSQASTDTPSHQETENNQHSDLAYVIFTSGSTGKPKGVMVGHSQVISLLDAVTPMLANDHNDVWTLFHSFAFDFSVWEIWGALTTGARLCIVPQESTWSADAFLELLKQEQVTILNQTPSAFYALTAAVNEAHTKTGARQTLSLRSVIFGGEALNLNKLNAWWKHYPEGKPRLINMYGITETTVHVTWLELSKTLFNNDSSPIGHALTGLQVHLLNEKLEPVNEGEVGEMFVSGKQLAIGYLKQAGLSASRFVASPFHKSQRLYRSGDLAMWQDGQLYYQGRADRQLKIRGFRIEPGEIESAMESHPVVQNCAVIPKPEKDGSSPKSLIAFLIATKDSHTEMNSKDTLSALRDHAISLLPAHYIPTEYVFVSSYPLTVNGKLDQAALLEIWQQKSNVPTAHDNRMALLQKKLAKLQKNYAQKEIE